MAERLHSLTDCTNSQEQNVCLNARVHRRAPHRRALPVPNKRQRHVDTKWFAYILRATKAQMSGVEAVVCEKLPLHTYAGTLAITPASAGQRSQQPTRRETTATDWGTPNNPRYSGDEEYTNIRVTGSAGQRSHTELEIRMLGFSSSNTGHGRGGLRLGDKHGDAHAESG